MCDDTRPPECLFVRHQPDCSPLPDRLGRSRVAKTTTPAYRLSWQQALSWRMRRHHLVERATPSDLVGVTADICGLHAQLTSSAELSLWARIDDLERDAVQDALWRQRTLVKLWATRGTLYVLPAAELSLWLAALGTYSKFGNTGHPQIDVLADASRPCPPGPRPDTRGTGARGRADHRLADVRRVCPLQLGLLPEGGLVPRPDLLRPERGRPRALHQSRLLDTRRARQAGRERGSSRDRTPLPGRLRTGHGSRSHRLVGGGRHQVRRAHARGARRGGGRG